MVNPPNPTAQHILDKLAQAAEYLLVPILIFFTPVGGILITVAFFIVFDTITGIVKSRKLGIPITSRGLSAIMSKMLLYQSTVISAFILETHVIGDIVFKIFSVNMLVTKLVAFILLYIEIKSINENFKAIRGINLWDALRSLLARAKEIKEDLGDVGLGGDSPYRGFPQRRHRTPRDYGHRDGEDLEP
jgi:hypothetical protein